MKFTTTDEIYAHSMGVKIDGTDAEMQNALRGWLETQARDSPPLVDASLADAALVEMTRRVFELGDAATRWAVSYEEQRIRAERAEAELAELRKARKG